MRTESKLLFTNRPKHLKFDNSFYFFSIRTISGQWFLRPRKYKQILLKVLKEKTEKFQSQLIAYVILNNHYHIILKIDEAKNIAKLIGQLNGASARAINVADGVIGRKIWWNYYDHVIRDETDFFKHLNYIHQNPVKHGLQANKVCLQTKACATRGSLSYEFSSYDAWVAKKGKEYLDDVFAKYPIIDFMVASDEY